jgi:hypothetical protein
VEGGSEDIIMRFCARGADIHAKDKNGATPLTDTVKFNYAYLASRMQNLAADASKRAGRSLMATQAPVSELTGLRNALRKALGPRAEVASPVAKHMLQTPKV